LKIANVGLLETVGGGIELMMLLWMIKGIVARIKLVGCIHTSPGSNWKQRVPSQ
jgi:hypothetical protein